MAHVPSLAAMGIWREFLSCACRSPAVPEGSERCENVRERKLILTAEPWEEATGFNFRCRELRSLGDGGRRAQASLL